MSDIVILFEHPQRDLENVIMLKYALEKIGYSCDLVKYPFINETILQLKYRNKVKCVITHSLYNDNVIYNLVYWIFGKADYIINLQCEQIHTRKCEDDINSYAWPKDYARNAYHICWGEKIVDILTRSQINRDKLLLTGPIQMDVWREEFRDFFVTKDELIDKYSLNPSHQIILFISSFSHAHLSDIALRQLRSNLGDEELNKITYISNISQKEILKWFKRYLTNHRDITLIYRKHPAENINTEIFNELCTFDNFRIISELPINDWIRNVDILLNWYSTAAVEAFFAKKSTIILRPVQMPYEEDIEIFNDVKFAESYEEFEYIMTNDKSKISLNPAVIEMYYDVKEIPSFNRAAMQIDKVLKSDNKFKWEKELLENLKKKYFQQRIKQIPFLIYYFFVEILRLVRKRSGMRYPEFINKRVNRRQLEYDRRIFEKEEVDYIMKNKKESIRDAIFDKKVMLR